jgi:hypothetical protein
MHQAPIVIVTPALADANNGNWQTARRWKSMLAARHPVALAASWPPAAGREPEPALMIALHARRSAASIAAWRQARPDTPLIVALTGTDLYRDIDADATAQRSLALADALIVLNELGVQRLPRALRPKCRVVLQSCSARQHRPHTNRHLRALMVGHLRWPPASHSTAGWAGCRTRPRGGASRPRMCWCTPAAWKAAHMS